MLVVTKLDRLGRNAIDVVQMVARLEAMGVRVHCLAVGGVDLTSPAGKMTMGVIVAVAQFERDLLIERTQAGVERARAEGTTLGRPAVLTPAQRAVVRARLAARASISTMASQLNTSRMTIMRTRDGGAADVALLPSVPPGPCPPNIHFFAWHTDPMHKNRIIISSA